MRSSQSWALSSKLALIGCLIFAQGVRADQEPGTDKAGPGPGAAAAMAGGKGGAAAAASGEPEYAKLLKDAKKEEGLITTYRDGEKLYAEFSGTNYSTEYIVLIAIARGIGQNPVLGGMTWSMGDDWVWQFRKVDDNVHIVRKNVRFRADKGKPEETAVDYAFTDSILFSLPIAAKGPQGGDLVDLSPVFFSDLPQLSMVLRGFAFSPSRSTWATVKGFPKNLELEIAATYASSGMEEIETVPDTRGVTINVHYSISAVPKSNYTPRLADDRIGYFLTAVKDFSIKSSRDRFVRYINRWNLKKVEPEEKVSPPVQPIKFYLEKTVPYKYRKPIREGILEWNKAFEAIGFVNAVEVQQQDEESDIDPEDVSYNFFRWITSSAGYAMGPSRVNPYTGEILDADIIFDADFLQFWKDEYATFIDTPSPPGPTPTNPSSILLRGNPWGAEQQIRAEVTGRQADTDLRRSCQLDSGMAFNFAFGSAALAAVAKPEELEALSEKLIMQGLKEVTMHEVGHTLGLRHNFRASTLLSLEDVNNPEKTKQTGMTASVMDYAPVNIVGKGATQGDYYSTTIGPYDMWAIEYGYKPLSGGTNGELKELEKIAARSGEPSLAFADDSDAPLPFDLDISPDPRVARFDLGNDPVAFAQRQYQLVQQLLPTVVDRMTGDGDNFVQARRAFQVLLGTHALAVEHVARQVGGLYVSRSHKGDAGGTQPITLVDAKRQKEALDLIHEQVLGPQAYNIAPEIFNKLGASRWFHWGTETPLRPDFPIHDSISRWQFRILRPLLSSTTLRRIHDNEARAGAEDDVLTIADLFQGLTRSIYAEVWELPQGPFSTRKPAINPLRRNLQKIYVRRLADFALGRAFVPADCQTLAFLELRELNGKISDLLGSAERSGGLDRYTRAHLVETSERIAKVLNADFFQFAP
ncbi:MAG: zinc-dependent metalloprotease [Planctomycetota bacterium]|nr:zinc-dependent metalloprotease [Planctomycetota bacterium]